MSTFDLVPLLILGVAAFTVLKTVVQMVRERSFTRSALSASGEVTDVREHRRQRQRSGNHGGTRTVVTYSPVLRFTLPDGRIVDAEAYEEGSSVPARGSQVAVLYDAGDPTRCRLDGGGAGRWGNHVLQLGVAVVMVVFALVFIGIG